MRNENCLHDWTVGEVDMLLNNGLYIVSRPSPSDHIEKFQSSSKWSPVFPRMEKGTPRKPSYGFVLLSSTSNHRIFVPKDSTLSICRLDFYPQVCMTAEPWDSQGKRPNFFILHPDYRFVNWTGNLASLSFCSGLITSAEMKSTRTNGARTEWLRIAHSGRFQFWYFWNPEFGQTWLCYLL